MFKLKIIKVLSLLSVLFFVAIALDLTPFLRGPADYSPDWRWQYQFVNTFARIWLPALVVFSTLFMFRKFEQNKTRETIVLVCAILLSVFFQFSVLYFSRSGISVLVHRIINPELNGYFTTATQIKDVGAFLSGFEQNVLRFSMHAQGHPPGAVLLFWAVNKVFEVFSYLNQISSGFTPSHSDVRAVWIALKPYEKTGALFIAFFIPILSSLVMIPLYYCSKLLYGVKTAVRTTFLYMFIPSLVLFIPINDVFLPIFTVVTLLFLLKGLKTPKKYNLFISGLTFSLGLFFSLSLLPLGLTFALLMLLYSNRNKIRQTLVLPSVLFIFGFFLLPLKLLLLFNFNFFTVSQTLMSGLPKFRAYQIWVFYNLYDFFIFCGIPILILFCWFAIREARTRFASKEFVAFTVMLFLLNFSGAVRGEVGRIWIPFVPFVVLLVSFFATKELKLTTKQFILILFLQALQVILMQEFWVMLS